MIKFNDWIKNLFSAVDQVLSEWVNSYWLFSRNKIEADTLNFWDTVKNLQETAAYQAVSRSMKFVSDSFELSFVSKKAQSLEKNALKFNEKSINEWKRRRCKNTKNSNESSVEWNKFNICKNCFATSNQENQLSQSLLTK